MVPSVAGNSAAGVFTPGAMAFSDEIESGSQQPSLADMVRRAIEFLQVLTLRRLGNRALTLARAIAPAVGLIALAAVLLVVAAQMPEPFEDGYGHWLIAANLAATGILHDPLFGMEDSWLPGYQVLAAAVLKVSGLWQLGLLKVLSGEAPANSVPSTSRR